jgi:hypothetical protein
VTHARKQRKWLKNVANNMSNICECGLDFGAPATLRIHKSKCSFVAPKEVTPEELKEVLEDKPKRGRPFKAK